MKRMFAAALICFTSLCCLTGCNLKLLNSDVIDENFFIQVIDEDNIALGNVKTYPQSGAVFFPERIQGYTVSQIGFNSGLGFGGNGYLYTVNLNGKNIERCYFPHTIKEIGDGHALSRVRNYLLAHKKIGRNDMCPCGSGLKYKKCHGKV